MESPPICVESSILLEAAWFKIYQQGNDYYIQSHVNERYLEIPSDPLDWSSVSAKASAVEPSNEARFAIEETVPPPPPYVYLAGSTDLEWFGGKTNFSDVPKTINLSANAFINAGAVVASDLNPTLDQLNANHNSSTRQKLESDYVFILGHGNKRQILSGKNDPAVISTFLTDNPTVLYEDIDWGKIKLVVFAGCETAEGFGVTDYNNYGQEYPNNIAHLAIMAGADCSLGWDYTTHAPSLSKWCRNFNTALAEGFTVNEAIAYAGTFNYVKNEIKNVCVYGDGNIRIVNPQ